MGKLDTFPLRWVFDFPVPVFINMHAATCRAMMILVMITQNNWGASRIENP